MPGKGHMELTSPLSRLQAVVESGAVWGTELVSAGKPDANSAGWTEFFQKPLLSENSCGPPPGASVASLSGPSLPC